MRSRATRSARRLLLLSALLGVVLLTILLTGDVLAWTGAATIPGSANAVSADTAVDPTTGKLHVAWFSYDNVNVTYNYSVCDPGTNSCSGAVALASAQNLGINAQYGNNDTMRPSVAVASDGTVYYAYPPGGLAYNTAVWKKKAPGSTSWTSPTSLGTGWGVRIAVDAAGNLHALWGSGGIINYKKFSKTGTLLKTINDIGSGGAGLVAIIADSSNNLHIVYESTTHDIRYRQVDAAGTIGPIIVLSSSPAYEQEPSVALDSGRLHVAFQSNSSGFPQIVHMDCALPISSPGSSCSALKIVSGGNSANWGSVAALGSRYFVSFNIVQNGNCGTNSRYAYLFSSRENSASAVDNRCMEWFTTLRASADGELHLVYRNVSGGPATLIYRHQASGAVNETKPNAPSNLGGTVDASGVHLTWTNNANNQTGFHVQRADGSCAAPGTFSTIGSPTTPTYDDSSVLGSHTYCYQVTAYNSAGDSNPSNTFEATTPAPPSPPGTPTNLSAVASLQGQPLSISLTWTPADATQAYFGVERGSGACASNPAFSQIGTNTLASYQDNSVGPNTTYCYRVYAHNAGGNSGYSNTAEATTTNEVHGTLTNLTQGTLAKEVLPSVLKNQNGDIIVAWEQDISTSSKKIQARVAPGGATFGGTTTIWNTFVGLGPSLFNSTGVDGNLLFHARSAAGGTFDGYRATLGGTIWSAAVNVTNTPGQTSQNPVGVQATDGKIWMAWRESTATLTNNVYARQLGAASTYQISFSGSAAPNPAIAAGTGGDTYVAWNDKGPSGTGCCIKVDKWTGSAWKALPDVTHALPLSPPSIAFGGGKLYAVWTSGAKVWQSAYDGAIWSTSAIYTGSSPKNAMISSSSAGTYYVVWADAGKVYLSKNGAAGKVISTGVTGAKQPAVFVDGGGLPYIAFSNNDIWYVANP